MNLGEKSTVIKAVAEIITDLAIAGISYNNPLLTWVRFIFTDDQPNANNQGVPQTEFSNLIASMTYMPIKANFNGNSVGGHDDAKIVGVIKEGQQEGNKLVGIGALYRDEYPEVVEYFKKELASGKKIDFSWEIRYKDSEVVDDIEWLKGVTTRAICVVNDPAYDGRTQLISLSHRSLLDIVEEELKNRKIEVIA